MTLTVNPPEKPEATPVAPEAVVAPVVPPAAYSSDNPEADAKAIAAMDAATAAREAAEVEETPPVEEVPTTEEEVKEAVGEINYDKYSGELSEAGTLSEESYAELEARGLPKDVVDTYVRGLQASADVQVNEILAPFGGVEEYSKMTAWAQANLTEAEVEEFNAAVTNPASARYAVKDLAAQYRAAEGSAPRLVQPSSAARAGGLEPFESSAQMVTAMRDSRYKTDSAYRNQVQQRLARSNF